MLSCLLSSSPTLSYPCPVLTDLVLSLSCVPLISVDILNDLLSFNKMEAAVFELHKEDVSARTFITKRLQLFLGPLFLDISCNRCVSSPLFWYHLPVTNTPLSSPYPSFISFSVALFNTPSRRVGIALHLSFDVPTMTPAESEPTHTLGTTLLSRGPSGGVSGEVVLGGVSGGVAEVGRGGGSSKDVRSLTDNDWLSIDKSKMDQVDFF